MNTSELSPSARSQEHRAVRESKRKRRYSRIKPGEHGTQTNMIHELGWVNCPTLFLTYNPKTNLWHPFGTVGFSRGYPIPETVPSPYRKANRAW